MSPARFNGRKPHLSCHVHIHCVVPGGRLSPAAAAARADTPPPPFALFSSHFL
ncbi:MAG: transposase [Kiritimatiellae bacterium]|nr:transposase [Kiritimatiellia bacterium]